MIPTETFGRTGHQSTRAIFGAAALGAVTQEEADRTVELLLRYGVNHIDTAASYGESELRLGPWMERQPRGLLPRHEDGRADLSGGVRPDPALPASGCASTQIDLIQLHNLVDPTEWETALGPGGALEAAIQAREEGLVRFIGVTGHGTTVAAMHARALERFAFDSVLLPYSYPLMLNRQYAADFEALVALCQQRNVAVQTIKSITRAPWGERPHTAATWYEPLQDPAAIDRAVHWVLGRPGVFLNTVGDVAVLPMVLDAADRFRARPSDEEMAELMEQEKLEPLFV